jgi:hypothetical protein
MLEYDTYILNKIKNYKSCNQKCTSRIKGGWEGGRLWVLQYHGLGFFASSCCRHLVLNSAKISKINSEV